PTAMRRALMASETSGILVPLKIPSGSTKIDAVALATLPALSVAVTVISFTPTLSKLNGTLQAEPDMFKVLATAPVLTLTTGVIPASTVPVRTKSSPLIGAVMGVMVRAGGMLSRVTVVVNVTGIPPASVPDTAILLSPSTRPARVALQVVAEGASAVIAGPLFTLTWTIDPRSFRPLMGKFLLLVRELTWLIVMGGVTATLPLASRAGILIKSGSPLGTTSSGWSKGAEWFLTRSSVSVFRKATMFALLALAFGPCRAPSW